MREINYTVVDQVDQFTVDQAAMLWHEIVSVNIGNVSEYLERKLLLVDAIKDGEIEAQSIPPDKNYEAAVVTREELFRWAIKKKAKPRFLFPTERSDYYENLFKAGATPTTPKNVTKTVSAPQKELAPRENEMHVLLERVFKVLSKELKRAPTAKEVWRGLQDRRVEFDTDSIICEFIGDTIEWRSMARNTKTMTYQAVANRISKIRQKLEKNHR